MNIILVGMMGSGKTSVGRVLAEQLGLRFVDTDANIADTAGRPIAEIFAALGEAGFRALESDVITRVVTGDNQVIATGGGAVVDPSNREALRRRGRVFWLCAPPEELLRRTQAEGLGVRPLLAGADPQGRLRSLAESRAEAYRLAAHCRIETEGRSPHEVAALILESLKETS